MFAGIQLKKLPIIMKTFDDAQNYPFRNKLSTICEHPIAKQ